MPKKGAGKSGDLDPLKLPPKLITTPHSLYGHCVKEFESLQRAGIAVPPMFIVVCNNAATSKLVYEWIAGWEREVGGVPQAIYHNNLSLFSK